MKILYFDCFAGISGDMTLGAFIDLGLSLDFLRTELKKLPFADFQIELEEVRKGGLLGKKVNVIQGSGPEEERSYQEIQQGILESNLSDGVKTLSLRFFRKLAEVEARIHGDRLEEVTFHEIGAIDSIVDLVGCAIALEYFQPEQVLASELPVGRGFVEASHSRLPLPAPATLEILKGVPVVPHPAAEETITPTGAVIIREVVQGFGGYPPMEVERVGYGAGTRDSRAGIPNLLRLVIGNKAGEWEIDSVCQIESTLDDMNPEIFAGLRRELEEAGALEVNYFPIQAKKDRPGILIRVLSREADRDRIVQTLFLGSSTSGIRFQRWERYLLPGPCRNRRQLNQLPW